MNELNRIKPYLKGRIPAIILLIILVLINTILIVAAPLAIAKIIDLYIITNKYLEMDKFLIALVVVYFIQMAVNYFSTIRVGILAQNIMFELRNNIFGKIQMMPMQFFIQNPSGDIIARVNNDTRKIDNFLSRYIFEFISSFFTFIGIGAFIFTQNVTLAITTWVFVIILIIFSRIIGPMVKKASTIQLESNASITTFLNENISNYKAVVAFNQQSNLDQEFNVLAQDNYLKSIKSRILTGLFRPLYNFAGLISQAIVTMVGIYLVSQGQLTTGILIAFILYTAKFYEPVNRLAAVYASFEQSLGAWARINEVMDMDPKGSNFLLTSSKDHESVDVDD
jgi:ATP-binding cassette, subfamily B, bacterial